MEAAHPSNGKKDLAGIILYEMWLWHFWCADRNHNLGIDIINFTLERLPELQVDGQLTPGTLLPADGQQGWSLFHRKMVKYSAFDTTTVTLNNESSQHLFLLLVNVLPVAYFTNMVQL